MSNIDRKTVEGFGEEWDSFDQIELPSEEHARLFKAYFSVFPIDELKGATGFDLGCGSGRWAAMLAPYVGTLHCIDPAEKALAVSRRRLSQCGNVNFHLAGVDEIPLEDDSQDFGYSLGVLHHIPDTESAMQSCVRKLKKGAPFLVYLYYSLENRPKWFRTLWQLSNILRRVISRLPFRVKKNVCGAIAAVIYFPLARSASLLERVGWSFVHHPLGAYRDKSFYTMRTDALDRFGTRLEQRFSKNEIEMMMERCGLGNIRFSEAVPFWVACGRKL